MNIEDKNTLANQRKEIKQWARNNLIGQTIPRSAGFAILRNLAADL